MLVGTYEPADVTQLVPIPQVAKTRKLLSTISITQTVEPTSELVVAVSFELVESTVVEVKPVIQMGTISVLQAEGGGAVKRAQEALGESEFGGVLPLTAQPPDPR